MASGSSKRIAGGGDHDRIDDELELRMVFQNAGDGSDVGGGEKHAGFRGGDGEGIEQQRDLIADDVHWDRMHGAHDVGGFRDHAGDGGEAVDVEMLEGFQVRLNAGAR